MAAEHVVSAAGAGVYTPEGYADALAKFGDAINPVIKRELGRVSKIVRAIFVARFTSRGVGKGVFGKKRSGAFKLVKTAVDGPKSGGTFTLSMELRGFAALQERGGHTKAPRQGAIYPKDKRALKLKLPSLGVVIVASARHKGATIRANPSGARAFAEAAPRISDALENAIVKAGTGIGIRKSGVVRGAA